MAQETHAPPDQLARQVQGASAALCHLLDASRGAVEAPIRSQLFGPERFAQHGHSLGLTHEARAAERRSTAFFPRLRENIRVLREAHDYIGAQASTGYDVSPAAVWLLDNFHLVEAQLEEIHDGLPRRYFRDLPVLVDEPLAGLPRVYGIAWAFVAHTDGAFDEELLRHFLAAYQQTRELTLGELWALPTTLRVVLVENLRRLAERIATNKAAREVANLCCDRLDEHDPVALDQLLALLNQRGVGRMFLTQMAQRLQDPGATPSADDAAQHARWLDWLAHALPDLAAAQAQQPADQAADNLSVGNAITSLRSIGDADWSDIVAHASVLTRRMLGAPTFAAERDDTRDETLHAIERLARRSGKSEVEVAEALLALMRGNDAEADNETDNDAGTAAKRDAGSVAGHWLRGPGKPQLLKAIGLDGGALATWQHWQTWLAFPAYLLALAVGTFVLVDWLLHRYGEPAEMPAALLVATVLLMLLPASEAVIALVNRLISESARPRRLPRLALAGGIPAEHRVLVVVPALLTSAEAAQALVHRLHLHHLANPQQHAQFALLTDFADADQQQQPGDADLLAAAVKGVEALNAEHVPDGTPRFIVLHRERSFSETEQRWIGWERKRGKLEQLIALLAADANALPFIDLGPASQLIPGAKYVVTLDSDTELPPGRLRDLVGVAAHPQNQPQLSADGRRVVSGYGILQPRVVTPLPAPGDATPYHWLFAGQCGIDPYSAATSEVYQDLFGVGTFTGKGLLHVQAMHAVLAARLPEGQVLSHDLLEGAMARCAAVTDITVVEDAPFHADVAASRVHRWTRGDWQLLPLLLRAGRYGIGAIDRWKMVDNLRRSLVAPFSLGLLLLCLAADGVSPWAALGLVFAAFAAGPLMGAVAGFAPSRDDIARRHFYRGAAADALRALTGGLWLLAQLLQQAVQQADAVLRALWRSFVSRRRLLQWTTAAAAQAHAALGLPAIAVRHGRETVFALLLLALLLGFGTPYPALAAVLCMAWAAAPLWTWWASTPRRRDAATEGGALAAHEREHLRDVARDTWRLFERCVGPQDHHLPPDNLQASPHDIVAHRTSPTNIGLYLLSAACARQFGWIGTQDLIRRLDATLTSMQGLQRYRGHFLNWYDTERHATLLPQYVSTVDSGNLSGHLLAVAQACLQLAKAPYDGTANAAAIAVARQRVDAARRLPGTATSPTSESDTLAWAEADLAATLASAQQDSDAVLVSIDAAAAEAAAQLRAIAATCQQLAWAPDYGFLYHRKRRLFHIGFRVVEQQLDASFYDLLASESRLTSLLAIAKADVPVSHWAALGRPFYASGTRVGLRSWSGSMFEYLMPSLVIAEPPGSVLHGACLAAVAEQIAFARTRGVPWGISESAYAARDHSLAYQYSPQGVPRLALRRTPADELVIAPYATGLATLVAPRDAAANLHALEARGARGRYGFMEALDYTPARMPGAGAPALVDTFMAHHQGMTIVAISNLLLADLPRRWGMADARIEAVASLLHERVPREVSALTSLPISPAVLPAAQRQPGLVREIVPGVAALEPSHLLSNGRYNVSLRANGAGASRLGSSGITRWRDDALRDAHGSFLYLRWDRQPQPVSLTLHPAPDPNAEYRATFHADRVCFDTAWPELHTHCTVWVSPEDDIEFRQIDIHNRGERPLALELLSAFEPTLADARADEAHPAFGNLFLTARWQPEHRALLLERKPRLVTESGLHAAHFIADVQLDGKPHQVPIGVQTDRRRWLGRNGSTARPLASFDPAPAQEAELDTGLDPMAALALQLQLAPNSKVRVTICTAASADAATLHAVVDKYRQTSHVERASLMSATLSGIRLRDLRIGADTFNAVQSLSTTLLLCVTRPGSAGWKPADDGPHCDRRLLWRFGISGDKPIVLVSAGAPQGMALLRALAQALQLWSWGGVACDLVVINAEPASYLMALQPELAMLRERHAAASALPDGAQQGANCGFFVLRSDELSAGDLVTLRTLARVRLQADGRPLAHHVREWIERHEAALQRQLDVSSTPLAALAALPMQNQKPPLQSGDFDAVTGEFRFDVNPQQRPPRPWINVLANPDFGSQVSEAGGGYSWALNSRLNQLTAWSNDPVGDPQAECFLLQDMKTMRLWNVAPSGGGDPAAHYRVAHGQGYTQIHHKSVVAGGELDVTASWCVDPDSAVKQVRLRLVNRGHRSLRLRAVGIVEWMMGGNRSDRCSVDTQPHLQRLPATAVAAGSAAPTDSGPRRLTALLATQRDHSAGFGNGTAFFAMAGAEDEAVEWTCDRRECFDARGRLVVPDHFGQGSGSGLDPCAAIASAITLGAGETAERVFLLGWAESPAEARALAVRAAAEPAIRRLRRNGAAWEKLLGAATVKTPDPLFDALVNRWLLYQTVSCRLWAKAGFYQAGGAFGFRDQLQDSMALAWAAPAMLRAQIVLGASRQWPEGDVQHWWHAPTGAGVRTHFSDDLLWLAHATVHYLAATGDRAVLDESAPFLEGITIPPGAEDAYYVPARSEQRASIYEHCARAIDRSLRTGSHGLPLMGTGDWNDGMNRVGHEGRGESVWLAWFLCKLAVDFAPIAMARGESDRAVRWENAVRDWKTALHGEAWDGQWFKRAFFDDGTPLGSDANGECRIDLIAQAWAVLSNAAQPAYQRMAMEALQTHLVDTDNGLLRLLDPPLAQQQPSAGYIQAYPAGVRENGGQYSHAGVWALMAQAQRGDAAAAWFSFTCLSPAHRSRHARHGAAYELEPYVMAGDVYSQPPYAGRGGWSWYTGSAAWLQRAALESLFGLNLHAETIGFTPCLPPHWPQAELTLRREGRVMHFVLVRDAAAVPAGATLLRPGELLRWRGLPGESTTHVLCTAAGPAAPSYSTERKPPMSANSEAF